MRKFFDKCKGFVASTAGAVAGIVGVASVAHASPEWYEITISTVPVTTIAGVVLTALAIIWVIRKSIKTTNRS